MLWTVTSEEIGKMAAGRLSDELEKGEIVYFPKSPVDLPDEEDLNFLRKNLPEYLQRKNVSYYPDAGRPTGIKRNTTGSARAEALLKSYSGRVSPPRAANWVVPRDGPACNRCSTRGAW